MTKLDEIEYPPAPRLFTCPCCKLSWRQSELGKYISHLKGMSKQIDASLESAQKAVAAMAKVAQG